MRKLISIILVLATGVVFAADDPARSISVSGTGSVELSPDKATLVSVDCRAGGGRGNGTEQGR